MGIRLCIVDLLARTIPKLGDISTKSILTVGVQDCPYTYDELSKYFRSHGFPQRELRAEDIELTSSFKGAPAQAVRWKDCVHQRTLFRAMGFPRDGIYSLDANDYEGADFIHDLNVPVPDSLASRFDVIFDGGSLEHVFSVKDSLFNLCRMCKQGGVVITLNPVDWIPHGFFNFNATLLRDFFPVNGFEELDLKYVPIPRDLNRNDHYLELEPEGFLCSLTPAF